MGYFEHIKRIVKVRKCVSCRTVLSEKDFDEAFCPECRLSWQVALTQSCPECYGAATECSCMPSQLSSAGAITLRKLFFYNAKKEKEPQNRLVYYLKHQKSRRAACFAAKALSRAARQELETLGAETGNVIAVNIPRGRRAALRYGFDQAQEVSEALARELGVAFCSPITRRFGGREQKTLNATQRKKNIKGLMSIKDEDAALVKGKYVLLFDDVVTTGASMAVSTSLLRRAGARGVICLALASEPKKEITFSR